MSVELFNVELFNVELFNVLNAHFLSFHARKQIIDKVTTGLKSSKLWRESNTFLEFGTSLSGVSPLVDLNLALSCYRDSYCRNKCFVDPRPEIWRYLNTLYGSVISVLYMCVCVCVVEYVYVSYSVQLLPNYSFLNISHFFI